MCMLISLLLLSLHLDNSANISYHAIFAPMLFVVLHCTLLLLYILFISNWTPPGFMMWTEEEVEKFCFVARKYYKNSADRNGQYWWFVDKLVISALVTMAIIVGTYILCILQRPDGWWMLIFLGGPPLVWLGTRGTKHLWSRRLLIVACFIFSVMALERIYYDRPWAYWVFNISPFLFPYIAWTVENCKKLRKNMCAEMTKMVTATCLVVSAILVALCVEKTISIPYVLAFLPFLIGNFLWISVSYRCPT